MKLFKTVLGTAVCAGLLAASLVLAINTHMVASASDKIYTNASTLSGYDCILVLGAGVYPSGEPTPMLRDRVNRGVELYKAGVSERLLMTGDHINDDYDEVNPMKNAALAAGAESEAVFMDHAGICTYDSIYRAKEVFCAKSVVIVTQRYHLYRALYVADALGLQAVGVPAEEITYSGQFFRDVRELAARAKDWVYTLIKPEPKYLGEAVPVWESGDLTNDK